MGALRLARKKGTGTENRKDARLAGLDEWDDGYQSDGQHPAAGEECITIISKRRNFPSIPSCELQLTVRFLQTIERLNQNSHAIPLHQG